MEKFYSILVHAHSGWRWVVLILLLAAIFKAFSGWRGQKPFTPGDKKLAMFAMVSYHLQFVIGLILYFAGASVSTKGVGALAVEGFMKVPVLRFFGMEHILLMTIGMILLTVGYSKAKRAADDNLKFKRIFIFYLITLLLILISIPWPFRTELAAGWF